MDSKKVKGIKKGDIVSGEIIKRLQAENALRESEMRLRQIIDLVPHMIFSKDEDGKFMIINKAMAEAYGKEVGNLLKVDQKDIHSVKEEVTQYLKDDKKVMKTQKLLHIPEQNFTDAKGNIRILETTKIPFRVAGTNAPAMLGVAVDITERKKAEKKIQELDMLRRKFINITAHQFRTPLNTIKWTLETLIQSGVGKISKEQEVFIRTTLDANNEIIRRLHDLLIVMDIEKGKVVLEKEDISIESLWGSVMTEMEKEAKIKNIKFTYLKPKKSLGEVNVDAQKIREAFTHLVRNAIIYTKEKGTVRVKLERTDGNFRFEVKDTGIGIPKVEQDSIFKRFFRATNAHTMFTDASGIGLSIVKFYIEEHNGTIGFESTEGKGSTFWFEIPVK